MFNRGCYNSQVLVIISLMAAMPPAQVWDVPPGWSLMDAASVPVAYLTCYYALVMRGGLQRGQRVLVHSGTGAVGLAAIRICRFRGCEARACAPLRPPKSARAAL